MKKLSFRSLGDLTPIPVEDILSDGLEIDVTVNETERASITEDLQLLKAADVSAEIYLANFDADAKEITGTLAIKGNITQACVVSLEPVDERLNASFELVFKLMASENQEEVEDLEEGTSRLSEVVSGDEIDLQPLILEALALSIDPYPRSDKSEPELPKSPFIHYHHDAAHEPGQTQESGDGKNRPFANLKDLLATKH